MDLIANQNIEDAQIGIQLSWMLGFNGKMFSRMKTEKAALNNVGKGAKKTQHLDAQVS